MNTYCNYLNFSVPIFNDTFNGRVDPADKSQNCHWTLPKDIMNQQFIDLLFGLDIYIYLVEVFYKYPKDDNDKGIHTDHLMGDYVKINCVFGGKNSRMQWWKTKPNALDTKELAETIIKTNWIGFDINEVDPVYDCELSYPSLVQVGIPHNIHNPTEERWCVSIVLMDTKTKERIKMADAYNRFRDYLI